MKRAFSCVTMNSMTPTSLRFPVLMAILLLTTLSVAKGRELPTIGGGSVSLANGVPTILTIIQHDNENAARKVGQYITDEQFATGEVTMITILNFQGNLQPSLEKITEAQIKMDLQKESARLGPIYRRLGVGHSPMKNLHVVTDFDGSVASSFKVDTAEDPAVVMIFDGKGRLVARFPGVPGRSQFLEYLKKAE